MTIIKRDQRPGALALSFIGGLLLVAACSEGGRSNDSAAAQPAATRDLAADEGPSGAMTYYGQKVEVDCDDVAIPPRAAGTPVDDVRGLRLGVPLDTAMRFVQCPRGEEADSVMLEGGGPELGRDDAGLKIRSFVRIASGAHKARWSGVDVLNYDPRNRLEQVDSEWSLYADGMPGREKLFAVWLTQPFAKGSEPTIASQRAALQKKYGNPHFIGDRGEMHWLYGGDGKPIPQFDREKLRNCAASISLRGTQMNWRPECGLTVVARVDEAYGNPQLAQAAHVAVFDSARYYDYEVNRFPAERDAQRASEASKADANAGGEF